MLSSWWLHLDPRVDSVCLCMSVSIQLEQRHKRFGCTLESGKEKTEILRGNCCLLGQTPLSQDMKHRKTWNDTWSPYQMSERRFLFEQHSGKMLEPSSDTKLFWSLVYQKACIALTQFCWVINQLFTWDRSTNALILSGFFCYENPQIP